MPFSHVHPTTRDRTPTRHPARLRRWASLVPAVLLPAVGLMASAPAATADPYAAQLSTSCEVSIPNVVKRGSPFQATVRVRANANLKVKDQSIRGRVTVKLRRVAGGQIWRATVPYSGSSVRLIGPALDVLGEYRATARFQLVSANRRSSGPIRRSAW
jgi:hypothetical protein